MSKTFEKLMNGAAHVEKFRPFPWKSPIPLRAISKYPNSSCNGIMHTTPIQENDILSVFYE